VVGDLLASREREIVNHYIADLLSGASINIGNNRENGLSQDIALWQELLSRWNEYVVVEVITILPCSKKGSLDERNEERIINLLDRSFERNTCLRENGKQSS